jgi:hypothetical protein
MTSKTQLRAVNGGSSGAGKCVLPKNAWIDWIMSTPEIQWTNYQVVRTPYVKKTSDHPIFWADATIEPPAAQLSGIKRVVVIDIEGLPSMALNINGGKNTPYINRMRDLGASTSNARPGPGQVGALPNTVSIVSGRPPQPAVGGHGVNWQTDNPRQRGRQFLHTPKGAYIPSFFDTVHDGGGSTSFMSSDRHADVVRRTYVKGRADTQGVNYGASKLSASSIRPNDLKATQVLETQLTINPRTVSYVQYSGPRLAGEASGYMSPTYEKAVRIADRQVGRILNKIRNTPKLATSTMVILTASTGGAGYKTVGNDPRHYTIPFIVWGNGVPAGANLYAMNPGRVLDPGSRIPGARGAQPIRNSNVANLVTQVLGYPVVPASKFGAGQDLNVFIR